MNGCNGIDGIYRKSPSCGHKKGIDRMKILQIIPAPKGLYTVYRNELDGLTYYPVFVLALVEEYGRRWVQPLDFDPINGVVKGQLPEDAGTDFKGYEFFGGIDDSPCFNKEDNSK